MIAPAGYPCQLHIYIFLCECTVLMLGKHASGLPETSARHMLVSMYIHTDKGAKATHMRSMLEHNGVKKCYNPQVHAHMHLHMYI